MNESEQQPNDRDESDASSTDGQQQAGQQEVAAKPNPFDPVLLVATGTGLGYSPIVPGTCGSLWGIPLALAIAQIEAFVEPGPLSLTIQVAVIAVLFLAGIPLCTSAARRLGGKKDPSAVVWDEIATMPVVFLFVPLADMWDPVVLAAGFVLHRAFDIVKPPPCRQLEALPDGLGIMSDDLVAAIYACGCLHLARWLVAF